ncbi:MAG: TerB family tellurite resistance protein, partial [Gemmatimonadota bacterium]
RIGANWDALSGAITNLNRSLLILAGGVVLGILGWVVVTRGRRRYRRTRAALGENLKSFPGLDVRAMEDPVAAAVAGLLLATPLTWSASAEGGLDTLEAHLRSRWHLGGRAHPALEVSPEAVATVVESLEPAARVGVARRLWQLAFSDGAFQRHEAHVMERAVQILGLPAEEVDRIRRRTEP